MILSSFFNLVGVACICFTVIAVVYLITRLVSGDGRQPCCCKEDKEEEKKREIRRRRRKSKEKKEEEKEDRDNEGEEDNKDEPEPEEEEEERIEWFYVEQDENANGVPQTSVTIEWDGVLRPLDGYRFRYRLYTYDNDKDTESVGNWQSSDITQAEMVQGWKKITGLTKSNDRYDRDYEFVLTDRSNKLVEDIDEEWVYMDY